MGRHGIGDASRLFHYTRTTADGRILWGGYDAVYHWNNGFGSHLEKDSASFARLAAHFFQAFPQLEGLRFTHAWGGAIDTCSRYSPFWGTVHHGKTAYVMGYTGLGVGASRFGARVLLDILDQKQTGRTRLEMVRTKAGSLSAGAFPLDRDQHHPPVNGMVGPPPGTGKPMAENNELAGAGI